MWSFRETAKTSKEVIQYLPADGVKPDVYCDAATGKTYENGRNLSEDMVG